MLSIPTVLGYKADTKTDINNDEWKIISLKGKCDYFSCGTILNFFGVYATYQPMRFYQVTEDTMITINGEEYILDGKSSILIEGFIGKLIWPFERITKEKQGLERPYDFTVYGIGKKIEITPEE